MDSIADTLAMDDAYEILTYILAHEASYISDSRDRMRRRLTVIICVVPLVALFASMTMTAIKKTRNVNVSSYVCRKIAICFFTE